METLLTKHTVIYLPYYTLYTLRNTTNIENKQHRGAYLRISAVWSSITLYYMNNENDNALILEHIVSTIRIMGDGNFIEGSALFYEELEGNNEDYKEYVRIRET